MFKQLLLLTALTVASLHAGVTSITLSTDLGLPGGDLTVTANQITGWGFTFDNDTGYALISSATYVHTGGVVVGGFLVDFIGPQAIVVGVAPESASVTQTFNTVTQRGIGTFQVNPGAMPGDVSTGYVQVTYDRFSVSPNDPLFNPVADALSFGNTAIAPASLSVIAGGGGAVPEPATGLLTGLALAGSIALGAWRRRR